MNHFKIIAITAAFAATASAASIPSDCNNNGIDDATDISNGTSADCNSNGIPDECELLRGTGEVAGESKIAEGSGAFPSSLDVGDNLGGAIAFLGDLDGDGVDDLAVGAPDDDDGGENAGALYVLFMNADETVKSVQKISASEGGFSGSLDIGDGFGASLAAVGDLDGDGNTELLVGSPDDDGAGDNAGAAWLLFLDVDGTVKSHVLYTEGANGFTGDLDVGDDFGWSVASVGDLDADGTIDVAIGAPDDDDGGENAGALWILFLNSDGTVKASTKASASSGGFGGTLDVGDHFGSSLGWLGDLDGDGTQELAVGAPHDDDGAENAGAVWILSLDDTGAVIGEQKISASSGGLAAALDVGDDFGTALAPLGDHDGDGLSDLAVGSPGDDDGGENAGAVHILFLAADGTVLSESKISASEGGFAGGLDVGDDFGFSLANVGDLNSDGISDLAAGTPDDDDGGENSGGLWLMTFATDDQDCDSNGVPDDCDPDCNANKVPDACDIADGTSTDCNGNALPDDCEYVDCNSNDIVDSCDIASGFSEDCNGNAIPDSCDIASGFSADCDANDVPDECQIDDDPSLDLNQNYVLDSCECFVLNYCTAAPNTVSATGAKMRMVGLPSISLNTTVLEATDCPASEFGIFYYGPWQVQLPFGDGYRCVAGSVFRLMPPMLSSGAGVASRTLDFNTPPMNSGAGQINAGSTWNFQYWYRDPTPVGYGFNLSDGLEVTFCP